MISAVLPVPHITVTRETAAAPLPDGVDPGLVRHAAARDIRRGDLVIGAVGGPLNQPDGMLGASPIALPFRALPTPHPTQSDRVALDGINHGWKALDEVLYVPAQWCAVEYRPGDRVERIAAVFPELPWENWRQFVQRGTVDLVDGNVIGVVWDGCSRRFLTGSDVIRPVDPTRLELERQAHGFATGDRAVLADGTAGGLVLEMWRSSFYGPVKARVMWDAAPGEEAQEETRPAGELSAETA